MALAYPGIVLVALVWILTPLIALPVAWVLWHNGPRLRDGIIFKGLISATIAFGLAAFPMIARSVNPNLWAGEMESRVAGTLSLLGLPAALLSIYAAVRGEGRGRVSLFLTGVMTGTYWFFGFLRSSNRIGCLESRGLAY
jgi:hypothetical protein